ncbi:MAG: type II toxin-antitoxin system VapC family toxin [Anaerolineales bacterium]|jgi:predicted nucleic acid-binding protein|nr:type II toxin-antitoxin system VapC family toxin [Anaerolineales bacterium]
MEELLVLDASVAIKAILPNPLQGHCRALVETFAEVQPVSPALWGHETTSAISKTVHFGQITEAEGRLALEQLAALNVQLFTPNLEQNQAAFDWTIRLKRAAAYDSYYLALAQSLDCDFWTADSRLFNALKGERFKWLHWIEEIPPLK